MQPYTKITVVREYGEGKGPSAISITEPGTEHNIHEMADIFRYLLLAMSYHPDSVDKIFIP